MTSAPATTTPTAYLPCVPEAAAAGRALAAWALALWGQHRIKDDVQLVVGELVANAARYAHGDGEHIVVSFANVNGRIRVAVRDACDDPPVLREPDWEAERGRGLMMVDALAAAWGCEHAWQGKTVWAEFPVTP